jgi:hypothetical protein
LAAPGRPHPPVAVLARVFAVVVGQVTVDVGRLVFGFGVEVPAFPALLDAEPFGPIGAGRAAVLPGRPARDRYDPDLA